MATQSSILAWRIPWTEEPGGLQSMRLQRDRHDWSDLVHMHTSLLYPFQTEGQFRACALPQSPTLFLEPSELILSWIDDHRTKYITICFAFTHFLTPMSQAIYIFQR